MLNYFAITPIYTSINNPQSNTLMERINQVICNITVTKYLYSKLYDYTDPWLASVVWAIRSSYHCTLYFTPGWSVFGGYMLFNIASIFDLRIVTTRKHWQVDIDKARKNARQVRHDYSVSNIVYVENTVIFHRLDYNKQGPYIITEVFINGTE